MGVTEQETSSGPRRRVVRLNPDDLAALEEERAFLKKSLIDLDREHEVGDVSDDDYATLQAGYETRFARLTREIESGKMELATAPRRSRVRVAVIVAGIVVFALLSGAAVAQLAGRRDAGRGVSGETAKSPRERNTECLSMARDRPVEAVGCYDEVLTEAPQNVEALTYRGWIRYTESDPAGLTDLFNAVKIDGNYPDVHAFLAVVLYQSGCASDAKGELDVLDTLNPSPLIQQQVAGLRDRINQELASPSPSSCPAGTR